MALILGGAPSAALAQQPPAPSAQLRDAMTKAEAGAPEALLKLADGGDVDAQYMAGVMFLFGGGNVAKDPDRGCAYEQKASVRRADAMHLVGLCHQNGAGGPPDKVKAEAAFRRADEMGFAKSKCALGRMLMTEASRAKEGLTLCEAAAGGGEVDAQMAAGDAYFAGAVVKRDPKAARKWYEMAARQNNAQASRRLGEMYAAGDGGRKDTKKAVELWTAAEKAGDPLASILVADQLFSDLTGGRKPGPGTYAFRDGVPTAEIEILEQWYKQAQASDPRPDVQQRAKYALSILSGLRTGARYSSDPTRR